MTNGTQFVNYNSIDNNVPYIDDRDKQKLCMPDKTFMKGIP